MRFLGLDLGSSFLKGAVLDADGLTVSHVERLPTPDFTQGLDPHFRETEPALLVEGVAALLERLHRHAPEAAGVLVCSQLHGMVLCDSAGRPHSRFINWQDQRALMPLPDGGQTCFDEVEAILTSDDRHQLGNERVPGTPLHYLFWFARNRTLPDFPVTPVSLPYFVMAQLCGTAPASDITHAYGHGALNIQSLTWHATAIEKLGLQTLRWPKIVPQGAVIGQWRHAGRTLPVFSPVGDYHCSQVGALLEQGELSINVSTGSAVIQIGNGPETGAFQTRPWFDGLYLKTITHLPAGRALNALVALLSELAVAQGASFPDPWAYIQAQAERSSGKGLRVNPAFYPGNMGSLGAISNLREENMNVGDLFHATLSGMADNYAACAARIAPGGDWSRLVFSGGVAMKNKLLRRLVCERLGEAHRLAPAAEDTLFGLLVLSLAFWGGAASVGEAIASVRRRICTHS